MALEAGKLRYRVRIDRYDYVRDSAGEIVQDPSTGETARQWLQVATVWAAIEPLSVREFITSQSMQSQVTARATIRYRADVDATCRLIHRGKFYNIAGVLADKESGLEYMTLPLTQRTSDGQ